VNNLKYQSGELLLLKTAQPQTIQVSLSKFNQDLKMRSSHGVGIGQLCENAALQTVWKISEVKHYGLRWQIMSFS
jgi:hypothetical protein